MFPVPSPVHRSQTQIPLRLLQQRTLSLQVLQSFTRYCETGSPSGSPMLSAIVWTYGSGCQRVRLADNGAEDADEAVGPYYHTEDESAVVRCLSSARSTKSFLHWPWSRRDLRRTSLPSSILVIVSLGASSRFLVDRLSRSTLGLWIGKRSARGHQQIAKSERIVLSSTSTARRSA